MSALPYKAVSWGDEYLSTEKLNQMTSNDQWLYENMPKMNFNTYGVKKTTGVKVMAAICIVPASTASSSSATFNFGTFFSPGCKPVITTGVQITQNTRWRNHAVIAGLSSYTPDHRGMKISLLANELSAAYNSIRTTYVHFIAVGW